MQIDGTSQIKLHGISHDFMNFHDPSARRKYRFQVIIRSAAEPGLSPPAIPPAAIIAVAVAPVVLAAVPVEIALVLLDLPAAIP